MPVIFFLTLVQPEVSCPETMVQAYVGTTYIFPQCNITANPPAIITWKRGFGSISDSRANINSDQLLEIPDVNASDDGLYIMRVENYLGKLFAEILV